jgi:hypothetical protein
MESDAAKLSRRRVRTPPERASEMRRRRGVVAGVDDGPGDGATMNGFRRSFVTLCGERERTSRREIIITITRTAESVNRS